MNSLGKLLLLSLSMFPTIHPMDRMDIDSEEKESFNTPQPLTKKNSFHDINEVKLSSENFTQTLQSLKNQNQLLNLVIEESLFSKANLSSEQIEEFFQSLGSRVICLSGFGEKEKIIKHLKYLTNLVKFCWCNFDQKSNRIDSEDVITILTSCPNLSELIIPGHNLNQNITNLSSKKFLSLTFLNARCNNIDDDGAKIIAEAFPYLTHLELAENNIGTPGAYHLANLRLHLLSIPANKIDDEGMQVLRNCRFKELYLYWKTW